MEELNTKFYKDPNTGNLVIEGAKLVFRNFAGVEKQYNEKGKRNVQVVVPDEVVESLRADGWNVTTRVIPAIDQEKPTNLLKLNLNYRVNPDGTPDGRNPKFYIISGDKKVRTLPTMKDLGDGMSPCIYDQCKITNCDIEVRPYHYDKNNPNKVSAYIEQINIEIALSALDLKYYDEVNDISSSSTDEDDLPF